MQSIFIKLLLFLYLTSSYLSSTHIHYKSLKPLDCKVHLLVKNLNSADIPTLQNTLYTCNICHSNTFYYISHWIEPTLKGFNAQAPPLLF